MKQPKTFLLLAVIVAVLLLGIAYAAISTVTLTVNGNVTASPDQGNFKVAFSGTPKVTGDGNGSLVIREGSNSLIADLNIAGMTEKNQTTTATIDITNTSADIVATLLETVSTVTENTVAEDGTKTPTSGYFDVKASLGVNELQPNGAADNANTTTLTIVVTMLKSPVDLDVNATFSVTVVATPSN